MKGALVFSWGNSVRGREAKSLEVFAQALSYYDDLAKQGRIDAHRVYLAATGNAGMRAGMLVVDGDREELAKIQLEPEYFKLIAAAQQIVENMTIEVFTGGRPDDIQDAMGTYGEVLAEHGLL